MRERIGKFQITRMIGHGAMGEVYLAKDPVLDRPVAVKTIRMGAPDPEAHARFEREARSAGSMNHPNIVTVFEFGVDEDVHYMAMEFVDGQDLGTALRSGAYTQEELLELLAQACEGLSFAHERGIVHRDIKPANILVSRIGKRPLAKLVDFGVAQVERSELTQKGNWMGTANYMAPEYLDSGKARPASDLFALGVVLYEILTGGRKPFTGDTPAAILGAILRQEPAPFSPEEKARLGPALTGTALKALAKTPEERYPSAEALAAAIREAAAAPRPRPEGSAGSRTLVVGKGGKGQCMSLRVALRQAEPGTRILVLPGTYRESLVVDKDVSILGQGDPLDVVIESPKGPCLVLDAGEVNLGSLTFSGAQDDPSPLLKACRGRIKVEVCEFDVKGGSALQAAGSAADTQLKGCKVRGEGPACIVADPNTVVRMEACEFTGAWRAGLRAGAGARLVLGGTKVRTQLGPAVHLLQGAQATLEDCVLEGREAGGIEIEAEARAELRRCRVADSLSVGVLVLERAQASLEDCELAGHGLSAIHGLEGSTILLRRCRLCGNAGMGGSVAGRGILTLEDCELASNQEPALWVDRGATAQVKACRIHDGRSFGVVCSRKGRGVLEDCEIYGNALTGARVEPGGSLLLVRCDLRDGKDTGILLFENAEVTLEECAVHRNARGGILLAKDASDPVIRGGNKLQDDLLRATGNGEAVKVAPVKKG